VGNFDINTQSGSITFPAIGKYTDALTGAVLNVITPMTTLSLAPGEYHVYSSATLAH
jgi:1,4-alpha-glucan branching enzyme